MEQHPVPQNISSYQFHLVGDMTLKQFLELASGVVMGVIIYATGLPGLIKWPLILFFAASGAALAFVPFEERPLEQWIFAFFRSIYSPTLFHWEKQSGVKYFQDENQPQVQPTTAPSPFSRVPILSKLEESENSYLNKITQLFNPQSAPYQVTTPPQASAPLPQAAPPPSPVSSSPQPLTQTIGVNNGSILTAHVQNDTGTQNFTPQTEVKKDIQIPQTTYISLDKSTDGEAGSVRPHIFVEESGQTPINLETTKVSQTLVGQAINNQPVSDLKAAQFSPQAAPPSLPTIPNTVSGQVMDASGNIIEGAIMEIKDETGRPVRALKTNKAGHFLTVTPLTDGRYQLHIEKEGFTFDPLTFETAGQIIQPIAIHAK